MAAGLAEKMHSMGYLTAASLALVLCGQTALAGECRDSLRPLLLKAEPDALQLAQVRRLCEQQSAAGDPDATYQLALFHLGLGGDWDPATAIPLIRQAAAQGVSEAQYWLAWQSEAGPELVHDNAAALDWYQRAAASRHRFALQRLAVAYEKGELGLPVDERQALELRAQIRRCEDADKAVQARSSP